MSYRAGWAFTLRDWEFGVRVGFPYREKEFYSAVKHHVPFSFALFIGPFTFDCRGDIQVIAFRCAVCAYIHSDEPAFTGPMHGFVVCFDCHEKAKKGILTEIHIHGDSCDGAYGVKQSEEEQK